MATPHIPAETRMRAVTLFPYRCGVAKTAACLDLAAALGRQVMVVDLHDNTCASRSVDLDMDVHHTVVAALWGMRPLTAMRRAVIAGVWLASDRPGSEYSMA